MNDTITTHSNAVDVCTVYSLSQHSKLGAEQARNSAKGQLSFTGNIQTAVIGHMTHSKVDRSETIEDDEDVVVCQLGKTEVHTN